MKTFNVILEGTTAILINRFDESAEGTGPAGSGKGTRRVHIQDENPREVAKRKCYFNERGEICHPSTWILRMLAEAGGAHKQRGSRKSLKYIVPAATFIASDLLPFYALDRTTPITNFEVDARPVTIPATKGRIMRFRPRLNAWVSRFALRVNDALIDPSMVRQLVVEGGRRGKVWRGRVGQGKVWVVMQ